MSIRKAGHVSWSFGDFNLSPLGFGLEKRQENCIKIVKFIIKYSCIAP
jgi:hypothetical protein